MSEILTKADAIYFFMFPGWESEYRSNRWHYASRWAKHLPVTLVQETSPENWGTVKESRIDNCNILNVLRLSDNVQGIQDILFQVEQIQEDIRNSGYKRVIFWMYNPNFVFAWNALPAIGRIYHATENHFQYSNNSEYFVCRLKGAITTADAVICCSDGVRSTYSQHTQADTVTISNGCEYALYASGQPDLELKNKAINFEKLIVYAGNIDDRIDLDLLLKSAKKHSNKLFVFFGKAHFNTKTNLALWKKTTALKNTEFFGYVDPSRLPDIYAAADVGILPYMPFPLLKNNTLPLKAFEMVASGLPIVAMHLEMIRPYENEGIVVVEDEDGFINAIDVLSRSGLSEDAKIELCSMGRIQDYENKFTTAYELVTTVLGDRKTPKSHLRDELGVSLNAKSLYLDVRINRVKGAGKTNAFSNKWWRFVALLARPPLMFIHRTVWPKLSEKYRQKIRDKLHHFIVYVLKL